MVNFYIRFRGFGARVIYSVLGMGGNKFFLNLLGLFTRLFEYYFWFSW